MKKRRPIALAGVARSIAAASDSNGVGKSPPA
jgi:hypothetical protein